MKHIGALLMAGLLVWAGGCATGPTRHFKATYSSFDQPTDHPANSDTPQGQIHFAGVPVAAVLKVYGTVSERTVVHGALPDASIDLQTDKPVDRVETLRLLDTVLAAHGITMVLAGDDIVKAVPTGKMSGEPAPEIDLPWQSLPDSSSYMQRTVQVKTVNVVDMMPVLSPFSKLPNSIIVDQNQNVLILRDYAANVKQELRLLEQFENQPRK